MKPNGLKTNKKSSSEEHTTRGVKKTTSAKGNKTVTEKKKSNTRVNRETKAELVKAQREQMLEVLQETKTANFQPTDDHDLQGTKETARSPTLAKQVNPESDDICCQVTKHILLSLEFQSSLYIHCICRKLNN